MKVTVVIDAFRAFTTASYVLERHPSSYVISTRTAVLTQLAKGAIDPLFIGKSEPGVQFTYTIPNSPTRTKQISIISRQVFHRTAAGAKGLLEAAKSDLILAAGFVNADATVAYIHTLECVEVDIVPMGHEGITPSLEDEFCAQYIQAGLDRQPFVHCDFRERLRQGPGAYFFSEDQKQYPRKDFERCLKFRRFDFAIKAVVYGDYAVLEKIVLPSGAV